MATEELGPWAPLALADTVALMRRFPARWWVTGGLALELYMGRSWRTHGDTDVSIVRVDAPRLQEALAGWEIFVATQGELRQWDGTTPRADLNENNLWCRRPQGAWQLDVTVGDGDDERWVYRRDPSLRRRWDDAVLRTSDGVPYLAPHLQLLFKSKRLLGKDEVDARVVVPALTDEMRDTLRVHLPADHPWRALLILRMPPRLTPAVEHRRRARRPSVQNGAVAEHEISISIPRKTVLHADVVFEVYGDGEKLGELHVSKGTIDWHPRNFRRIASLTWEQFDRLMRDRLDADGRAR